MVDALGAKAMQEGALGLGTARYLDGARTSAALPEGAQWRTVHVKFSRCWRQACKFETQCCH